MTLRNEAPDDARYDAIVIGSGAGGLTCATRLAQSGLRVLLAEKNSWLGGYSHGFAKDGFYWDHGGHIFLAYALGGQAREVFQRLKLDQRLEMVPDQHDYQCIFPDESLALPAEMSTAADIMARRFPAERDGITKVLLTMERLIQEVDRVVPSFRVGVKPGERETPGPGTGAVSAPVAGQTDVADRPGRADSRRHAAQVSNSHPEGSAGRASP